MAPLVGACGRVAVPGDKRHCPFTGDAVVLLDPPAREPRAALTG